MRARKGLFPRFIVAVLTLLGSAALTAGRIDRKPRKPLCLTSIAHSLIIRTGLRWTKKRLRPSGPVVAGRCTAALRGRPDGPRPRRDPACIRAG